MLSGVWRLLSVVKSTTSKTRLSFRNHPTRLTPQPVLNTGTRNPNSSFLYVLVQSSRARPQARPPTSRCRPMKFRQSDVLEPMMLASGTMRARPARLGSWIRRVTRPCQVLAPAAAAHLKEAPVHWQQPCMRDSGHKPRR